MSEQDKWVNELWPEEDWLKPIGQLMIKLPPIEPFELIRRDNEYMSRVFDGCMLNDQIGNVYVGSFVSAELYQTSAAFSLEHVLVIEKYRKRINIGGLGVATLVANYRSDLKLMMLAFGMKDAFFPVASSGSNLMQFWHLALKAGDNYSLRLVVGDVPSESTLVMYRKA